jgi:hypothetical protein
VPSQLYSRSAQLVPPIFSAAGLHSASVSIQVGLDGAADYTMR